MRAAYQALDDATRERVGSLSAHHSIRYSQARIGHTDLTGGAGYGADVADPPLRPLVKIHPVTGRPSLFIGNRTLYDIFFALPLLVAKIDEATGVFVRGIADQTLGDIPFPAVRRWLERYGILVGTAESCAALMGAGESILVLPGGARELYKRDGEQYRLLWEDHIGFARLAAQHRYTITPFGVVGPENSFSIVLDGLLRGGKRVPPLVRGIGLTPIPRPEPFYYCFGRPIYTEPFEDRWQDDEACWQIRRFAMNRVHEMMAEAALERARDQATQPWLRRFLCSL